jgi:hypothetical protein
MARPRLGARRGRHHSRRLGRARNSADHPLIWRWLAQLRAAALRRRARRPEALWAANAGRSLSKSRPWAFRLELQYQLPISRGHSPREQCVRRRANAENACRLDSGLEVHARDELTVQVLLEKLAPLLDQLPHFDADVRAQEILDRPLSQPRQRTNQETASTDVVAEVCLRDAARPGLPHPAAVQRKSI